MTEAHTKEQISRAYMGVLAACAGMTISTASQDYGIDETFKDVEYDPIAKEYSETGYGLDYQLKATVNARVKNGVIKYSLEMKNYRKLIQTRVGTPRILVVYAMPKEADKWVVVEKDETTLQKCAWWCSLKGKPEVNNKERVTVSIPINQQLTPESLKEMMNKVKDGVEL